MKKHFFLLLMIANTCCAQTIENYLAPAFPTELTASADGKTIAWVFNDRGSRIFLLQTVLYLLRKL
jgi:hypothetical protein